MSEPPHDPTDPATLQLIYRLATGTALPKLSAEQTLTIIAKLAI